ncbi:MAG: hypothetical protein AAGI07_10740 [Bacteroidota bacterium]
MKIFSIAYNKFTQRLKWSFSINGIILLGVGCLLSFVGYAQKIDIKETYKEKKRYAIIYSKYVTPAQLTFPAKEINSIKMSNGAGKIEVVSSEKDEIEIEASVENRALSKKKAKKFIEKYLQLSMENINGELVIKSYFEGKLRRKYERRYGLGHLIETPGSRTNVVLKVPAGIQLNIYDRSGSILIHGLENDIVLNDRSGSTVIKNVTGDVKIKDNSGNLSVQNQEGDLEIKDRSGSLYLESIGLNKKNYQIDIKDTSGGIKAKGLGGDVRLRDKSGTVDLNMITGSVEVTDASGYLNISEVGSYVKVNDKSGSIYLKEIARNEQVPYRISINDSSGSIFLHSAGTGAYIKDRSGRITVKDIKGDLEIIDRSGGISARDISGELSVKNNSGKIHADNYFVKNR